MVLAGAIKFKRSDVARSIHSQLMDAQAGPFMCVRVAAALSFVSTPSSWTDVAVSVSVSTGAQEEQIQGGGRGGLVGAA